MYSRPLTEGLTNPYGSFAHLFEMTPKGAQNLCTFLVCSNAATEKGGQGGESRAGVVLQQA